MRKLVCSRHNRGPWAQENLSQNSTPSKCFFLHRRDSLTHSLTHYPLLEARQLRLPIIVPTLYSKAKKTAFHGIALDRIATVASVSPSIPADPPHHPTFFHGVYCKQKEQLCRLLRLIDFCKHNQLYCFATFSSVLEVLYSSLASTCALLRP